MKKWLIIGVLTIFLIILGFSGCLNNNSDNNNKNNGGNSEGNLFIGTWKDTPYTIENGTRKNQSSSNVTFYYNGTMRTESVYDEEILWTPYIIKNNQICFGAVNDPEYLCYNYIFSNNNTKVLLDATIEDQEAGFSYELFVELIKK